MSQYHKDVCVIGASITGLTAAVELAKHGIQVTVLDPNTPKTTASIGHGVASVLQGQHLLNLVKTKGEDSVIRYLRSCQNAITWSRELYLTKYKNIVHQLATERCFTAKGDEILRHEARLFRKAGWQIEFSKRQPLPNNIIFHAGIDLDNQLVIEPENYAQILFDQAKSLGVEVVNSVTVVRLRQQSNSHLIYYRSQIKWESDLVVQRFSRVIDTLAVSPWGSVASRKDYEKAPVVTLALPDKLDYAISLVDSPARLLYPCGDKVTVVGYPSKPSKFHLAKKELVNWISHNLRTEEKIISTIKFDLAKDNLATYGTSVIKGGFRAGGNGFWELVSGTATGIALGKSLIAATDLDRYYRLPLVTKARGKLRMIFKHDFHKT